MGLVGDMGLGLVLFDFIETISLKCAGWLAGCGMHVG